MEFISTTNMDYSKITLGELLSSDNETIKRNAISILKQFQKPMTDEYCQSLVIAGLETMLKRQLIERSDFNECEANSYILSIKKSLKIPLN